MSANGDWPFDQSRDCAVITLPTIISGGIPVLLVTHDEDDHGWQFLDGRDVGESNAAVVGLGEIVDLDPTVLDVADLPPGWRASRDAIGQPWRRERSSAS